MSQHQSVNRLVSLFVISLALPVVQGCDQRGGDESDDERGDNLFPKEQDPQPVAQNPQSTYNVVGDPDAVDEYENDDSEESYVDLINESVISFVAESDDVVEDASDDDFTPASVPTELEPPTPIDEPSADDELEQSSEPDSKDDEPPATAGQLTAGQWKDVLHWEFWQDLTDPSVPGPWADTVAAWGMRLNLVYPVEVTSAGEPVSNAVVTLLSDSTGNTLWTSKTDNEGHAYLVSGFEADTTQRKTVTIEVKSGAASGSLEDPQSNGEMNPIELSGGAESSTLGLDVMFVMDTTGSMVDELDYLQAEIGDVIEAVEAEHGEGLDIRLSVNMYRDEGEEFVLKSYPFTDDIDYAVGRLALQDAAGGGDVAEAFDLALDDAISAHDWRPEIRSKVLFFIADAPPHLSDDGNTLMRESVEAAAEMGVRIVPIAASGTDKETEFLMRSMAIATGGTYVFTTDDSGIGTGHTDPTVGVYEVRLLNDVIIDLLNSSLD